MSIFRTIVFCVALIGGAVTAPAALAKPPAEAFGEPMVRLAVMSPDGTKVASVWSAKGGEVLVVTDTVTGKSRALANLSSVSPRSLEFVSADYVVAVVSQTRSAEWRGEKFEYSIAFSFNLKTGTFVELQSATPGLIKQTGLGRVLGVSPDGAYVYMPAWTRRDGRDPTNALYKVSLATGASGLIENGTTATIDWIVGPSGRPQMREEFFERTGKHTFLRLNEGKWETVFSEDSGDVTISLVGLRAGDGAPLAEAYSDSDVLSLYALNADKQELTSVLSREDVDIEAFMMDANHIVHGVRYSGTTPTYEFFDPAIDSAVNKIQKALAGTSTYVTDWSKDWGKILLYSDGGATSGEYFIFDRATGSLQSLMGVRPAITDEWVADVDPYSYSARDGLKIPALVTWPVGLAAADRKNLPLVVLPHGGPAAYDALGYDDLAQFFANEGYVVLQPNFRGSSGFGLAFEDAGNNEWGRKMQDDITDGVGALVADGSVNAKRICIVGWSYGGYAALAGGALTPDLYACVASVAGVSDLREMLDWEYDRLGERSRGYHYWIDKIGDPNKDGAAIEKVSPARLASRFKAPVLLIHGNDDTTVPPSQSNKMADALKGAGKTVTFQRIIGDDHQLGRGQNRKLVYESLAAFVKANMPAQ